MGFTNVTFPVLAAFMLFFLSGCCITPPGPDENHIDFYVPQQLPDAAAGVPYSYSFCEPDSARSGAVCGGLTPATNPLGGRPPYSMIYGNGLHPTGINLALNGTFEGTPTIEGDYNFEVCARDGFGTESCQQTSMRVGPAPPRISVTPDYVVVKAPICFNAPCKATTKVVVSSTVPWHISMGTGSATDRCYDTVAEFSRYWSMCPPSGPAGDTEVEFSTMVYGESTPDYMEELLRDRGSTWKIASPDEDVKTELKIVLELPYYQ
ncbi:MAG: hypothetical protein V1492_03970 [Candidatus Micrarchaeota archaeon]